MKPKVVVATQKQMDKWMYPQRNVQAAYSRKENTIYHTKDATKYDIEHEKVHCRLGHKKPRNAYQYIIGELSAEKAAKRKLGGKVSGRFVSYLKRDARKLFPDNKNINGIAERAMKRIGG